MFGSSFHHRKSGNDAYYSENSLRSPNTSSLARNHSARGSTRRRNSNTNNGHNNYVNGSSNSNSNSNSNNNNNGRSNVRGKKCFRIAVISEGTVTIAELVAVIKKTCKLTRCRFQNEENNVAFASAASHLKNDEKSHLFSFCRCSLPEETPPLTTNDVNHTVNSTTTVLQYLNEDNLVHLTVIKMLEDVNFEQVLSKIKGYDAMILAYSVSENLSFIRVQTIIELVASLSTFHMPVLLTGLIDGDGSRFHRQVSHNCTSELKDLYKILTLELDLQSPSVIKNFKESWSSLFKRIIWEREISSFKDMDESIKRYYSILSSSSNSAETAESLDKNLVDNPAAARKQGSSLKVVTQTEFLSPRRKFSRVSLLSDDMESDGSEPGGLKAGSSGSGSHSNIQKNGKTVKFLRCMLQYLYRKRDFDIDIAKSFLVLYPKYLDPETLLNFMIREYYEIESEAFMCNRDAEFSNTPQLRLINAIIIWMKMFAVDFSSDMLASLRDLVDNSMHDNANLFTRLSKMITVVVKNRRDEKALSSPYSPYSLSPYSIKTSRYTTLPMLYQTRSVLSPKGFDRVSVALGRKLVRKINAEEHINKVFCTPNFTQIRLEDLDSTNVAQQLTLIQWNIFSAIELRDIIDFSILGKSTSSNNASNLVDKVDNEIERKSTLNEHFKHFNYIADWVSTYILSFGEPKSRVNAIVKCVQIASELRRLNNFSSLMAFIGGIYNPAIRRLKETQRLLKKRKKVYRELVDLSKYHNPSQSFGAYRMALRACDPGTPCIPYLGVITQDLLKINEGNSDLKVIEGKEDQINIPKLKLIGEVIEPWQRYKSMDYWSLGFVKMERLQAWIRSRQVSTERELFQLSKIREP